MPLTSKGELKEAERIAEILGKKRLRKIGFDMPVGPMSPWEYVVLNRLEEELPSVDDITKADEIEMQELGKNAEDLISQITQTDDDLLGHPLCELLGLDKQLRSIRGSLKVVVARKVKLEEKIKK